MLLEIILSIAALVTTPEMDGQHSARENFRPSAYGPQTVEEAAKADRALHGRHFGGDIVLPKDRLGGAGDLDTKWRWHGYPGSAVIPYVIDPSLDSIKPMIKQAVEEFRKVTCVRWVERTNETDYVRLFSGSGCWSYLGMNGGHQDLSLGPGCWYIGLVIHEMAHAIGLYHEHQRSDRDTYVTVFDKNVRPGQEQNFKKTDPAIELLFTDYDYDSIMHYGEYSFSIASNLKTMEAKNGHPIQEPYDKPGMVASDISAIKQLYKCA